MEIKNNYTMGIRPVRPYRINALPSAAELHALLLREEGIDVPVSEDVHALSQRRRVGGKYIPNSIAVQPCEGFDALPDGNPSDRTIRRYMNFAKGGAGLIWFEGCGVSNDGKDSPCQLTMNQENIPAMQKLIREMDAVATQRFGADHKPYKVLQISHSGRKSTDASWTPKPIVGSHNPFFDCTQRGTIIIADDAYIEQQIEHYIQTAENAMLAGFDGIDIKICHGYFLSSLMNAFIREGKYGGCFENRVRAILEITDGIRKRCGSGIDLCYRINAYDAVPYPHGWGMKKVAGLMEPDLDEPIRLLCLLCDHGLVMANISTSDSRFSPYGDGLFAKTRGIAPNPYQGEYALLNATREIKQAVPELTYIGTGMAWFEKYSGNVAAGCIEQDYFDIAGFGRAALIDPEFASALLTNGSLATDRICRLCDCCHELSMKGYGCAGCVANPDENYAELYRTNVLGRK